MNSKTLYCMFIFKSITIEDDQYSNDKETDHKNNIKYPNMNKKLKKFISDTCKFFDIFY